MAGRTFDYDAVYGLLAEGVGVNEVSRRLGVNPSSVVRLKYVEGAEKAVPVPSWVPESLRDDYRTIALEDGEQAAASYARNKKRPALKPERLVDRDVQIPAPDRNLTREAYLAAMAGVERRDHSLHSIVRIVAVVTGYTVSELRSPQREENLVKARHIAAYLGCRCVERSLRQVGVALGGRDHSTILHSKRRVQAAVLGLRIEWTDDVVEMAQRLWDADWARTAR